MNEMRTQEGALGVSAEPRRRPGGRTREHTERIHAAAIDVLLAEGLPGLTFQRVATDAGVGRATMYRRWSSPAQLAVEAIRSTANAQIRVHDTGSLAGDLGDLLGQIGAFIGTPVGRAAVAAGLQIIPTDESENDAPAGWARRWEEVTVVFDRAIARGELAASIDAQAAFAALAGALYFRVIVMGRSVTPEWIERVLALPLTRVEG